MIPHKSRTRHNPPDTYGDCLRACVASVLDIEPPTLVPHFFVDGCDADTAMERLNFFLKEHNCRTFFVYFNGETPLDDVLHTMGVSNPGVYYLLFGRSSHADHVVIGLDNQIVHDSAWITADMAGPGSNGHWTVVVFISDKMVAPC